MDSDSEGLVIAKGSSVLIIEAKDVFILVKLHYTLKLESKDNRYSYEVYSLNYETAGGNFTADMLFSKEKEAEFQKASDNATAIPEKYRDKTI